MPANAQENTHLVYYNEEIMTRKEITQILQAKNEPIVLAIIQNVNMLIFKVDQLEKRLNNTLWQRVKAKFKK
jgi:hypothetical protein